MVLVPQLKLIDLGACEKFAESDVFFLWRSANMKRLHGKRLMDIMFMNLKLI